MSDSQNQMYPDREHVHRWGDDGALPARERHGRLLIPGATPRALAWGLGIGAAICLGIAIACMVILSGCTVAKPACQLDGKGLVANPPCEFTAETLAAKASFDRQVAAERQRLLREQHKDIDKTMRDFRMP